MMDQILVSMAATIAFAVLFHVPRSEYLLCGINGAIGWMVYLFCISKGSGAVLASVWAALALTLIARILSAVRKMPSTVFLITGIFTLVPGAGIYYTSYYLIMNDLEQCAAKGMETFKIAGAIVLGIIFGLMLPQSWFNRLGRAYSKRRSANEKI